MLKKIWKIIMPPKTAAERMREYRSRMSEEKKMVVLEKNRQQQNRCRAKWDANRRKVEAIGSRERMRKSRLKRCSTPASVTSQYSSPSKAFGSKQSFGKAMTKASSSLPRSPRKKVAVVKKLAHKFGLRVKLHEPEKVTEPSLLETTVKNFYESDLVSRQLPGRKDFVTIRLENGTKDRVQKKILMTTVMEAYQKFKNEYPAVKIGKSKFASLRPHNIVPVSEKDQTVCCCCYHENFEMLLNGIRQWIATIPTADALISKSVCNPSLKCSLGDCSECKDVSKVIEDVFEDSTDPDLSSPCTYCQWNNENKKVKVESTLSSAKAELCKQLPIMRRHSYIAKMQLRQIKQLKENLSDQEAVIQEDFSENFQIKQQDEIMSAHWVTNGVTLFTAVINTNKGVKSYVVISDELKHDKFSVQAFNRAILSEASETITVVHFFTDGAGSQFKNRFTLSNLLRPQLIHPSLKHVDWSFFATAHGKGPVDGIGGTVKRAVWRRILQKRVFLNTPEEFASVAKESCPNVNVLYVSSADIAIVRDEMARLWGDEMPLTIPDIRRAHYFKPRSENELEVSTISPFLPLEDIEAMEYRKVLVFQYKENSKDDASGMSTQIQREEYYAVDFVDKFYIGRVLSPGSTSEFWKMKFLHQSSLEGVPVFNWPATDDCEDIHQSVIFYGPVTLDGVLDNFTVKNIKTIAHTFENFRKKFC